MQHRIPFFLVLRLSVWWFQMPFEWLSFGKTLHLDLRNRPTSTKYYTFDTFECKRLEIMWNYLRKLFKIRVVYHALSLKRSRRSPVFSSFLTFLVIHYLTAVKFFKRSVDWKIFVQTSLQGRFCIEKLVASYKESLNQSDCWKLCSALKLLSK